MKTPSLAVFPAALALLAVLVTATATRDARADAPADAQRITAEIDHLRSSNGVVRCSIFASAEGFPRDPQRAVRRVTASIQNGRAVCAFDGLAPGTYAVSFLHDRNENGKMDTNWLGIPTEEFGASNGARGTMGPPSFADARFAYRGGAVTLHLTPAR